MILSWAIRKLDVLDTELNGQKLKYVRVIKLQPLTTLKVV